MQKVRRAADLAWELDSNLRFTTRYRETVASITGRAVPSDIYAIALNKMTMNQAETSRHPHIVEELRRDGIARTKDPLYRSPPALSVPNGDQMWFRAFRLKEPERALAADILHESIHLVGMLDEPFSEWAIEALHNIAGLPR